MTKLTERDWLQAGIEVLEVSGVSALTVQALLTRLGVTKGSFYHHFAGMDAYVTALLDYFEEQGTLQVIADVEKEQRPAARLRLLISMSTSYPPQLEIVMRGWAAQDERVRAVHERVDKQRIAYVEGLCLEVVGDKERAKRLAQMMYAILIGSNHMVPPLTPRQTQAVFDEFFSSVALDS